MGSMDVSDDGYATVIDGLTLNGTIDIADANGASATLDFDDSEGT